MIHFCRKDSNRFPTRLNGFNLALLKLENRALCFRSNLYKSQLVLLFQLCVLPFLKIFSRECNFSKLEYLMTGLN